MRRVSRSGSGLVGQVSVVDIVLKVIALAFWMCAVGAGFALADRIIDPKPAGVLQTVGAPNLETATVPMAPGPVRRTKVLLGVHFAFAAPGLLLWLGFVAFGVQALGWAAMSAAVLAVALGTTLFLVNAAQRRAVGHGGEGPTPRIVLYHGGFAVVTAAFTLAGILL